MAVKASDPKQRAAKLHEQLQATRERLEAARERLKDSDSDTATVAEVGLTQKTKLPKVALDAAAQAAALVAEGKHAHVIVVEDEISTSTASRILGVSRPHFIGLLDAGHLPYRKSSEKDNAHRYVKTDDVLDYKRRRADAQATMDEYGAISEELGA